MENLVSRGDFTKGLFTTLILSGLPCKPQGYTRVREEAKGSSKLYLPKGENSPENGEYDFYLKNRGMSDLDLIYIQFRLPSLNFSMLLSSLPKSGFKVESFISVPNQTKAMDAFTLQLTHLDYSNPHNLNIKWNNWRFTQVLLDDVLRSFNPLNT